MVTALSEKAKGAEATIRRVTLGSFLWVAVAATIPIHRFITSNISSKYPYVILALLILCVVFGRLRRPPGAPVWIIALVAIPAAAFIAGFSSSLSASTLVGVEIALMLGLAPFVFRYYVEVVPAILPQAIAAFLAVQAVSSAVGLLQLVGVNLFGTEANAGRANGLGGHPNVLGLMAALAILISIAILAKAHRKWRAFGLLSLILNASALIATGSLSSMIALLAGLIVLLICMRITGKVAVVVIGALCLIVPVFVFVVNDPSLLTAAVGHRIDVVTGEADDGVASLGIRTQTYQFALDYIGRSPIVGVGMDPTHEGTFNGITVVHDYILRAWYQGGLAYFIVIAMLTIALGRMVFQACRQGRDGAAAAVITATITFALTSAFFEQQQYWLPVLFSVAVLSRSSARRNSTEGEQPVHREPQVATAGALRAR